MGVGQDSSYTQFHFECVFFPKSMYMKILLRFLILPFLFITYWFFSTSSVDGVYGVYYSSGPASSGMDKTGSPIAGGATCSQCHSGGNYGTGISVTVKNSMGNPVTSYTPGATYTVEYQATNSIGSPAGFGFQSVALTGTNANAGNFSAFSTPNSHIITLNTRKYAEHSGVSSSGFFSFTWQAPTAGTGNVTFYSVANAVNGSGSGGDQASAPIQTVLTETSPTTISYGASQLCEDASDPTPTINGTQGGTFTSSPAGLSINSSTGTIDLSASNTGITYTITYTHSNGTSTATFRVNPTYSINYTATICSNDSIFLAGAWQNTPGTYTSNLTTTKGCDSTVVTTLFVNPSPTVSVNNATICPGQSATLTATPSQGGGTYLWTNTGETAQSITVSPSVTTTYAVTYTMNGCSGTGTGIVTILPEYSTTQTINLCEGDSVQLMGTYYSSSATVIDSSNTTFGCDSVTVYQVVVDPLNLNVTLSGVTLTADQNGGVYQWLDCSNNSPIPGATQQSYTATQNGDYAVIVTLGNCEDTSACRTVNTVGIESLSGTDFAVYPNPNKGQFTIALKGVQTADLVLFSGAGQEVLKDSFSSSTKQYDLNLATGVYLLQIRTENGIEIRKLIVE